MISQLLSGMAGGAIAVLTTGLAIALGMQRGHFTVLLTLQSLSGVGGAIAANAITRKVDKRQNLDRAIGVISERYALNPDSTNILIALEELKQEVKYDSDRAL